MLAVYLQRRKLVRSFPQRIAIRYKTLRLTDSCFCSPCSATEGCGRGRLETRAGNLHFLVCVVGGCAQESESASSACPVLWPSLVDACSHDIFCLLLCRLLSIDGTL